MSVSIGARTEHLSKTGNNDNFISFCKKALPYSFAATILWGMHQEILKASPATVVLCNSYAFQILAALCIIKGAWETIKLGSPSLSSRNVQKLVLTQAEADSLRAENARLRQQLRYARMYTTRSLKLGF